jgi:hypothetical protein
MSILLLSYKACLFRLKLCWKFTHYQCYAFPFNHTNQCHQWQDLYRQKFISITQLTIWEFYLFRLRIPCDQEVTSSNQGNWSSPGGVMRNTGEKRNCLKPMPFIVHYQAGWGVCTSSEVPLLTEVISTTSLIHIFNKFK